MTGFEPAASCSQSRRATSCATPGYFVILSGWSYSPKCRALPVELHPDIHFSAMIPWRVIKIKIFLSVVIYVVKGDFVPFSATGEKPDIARVARLCGVSPCPAPDTATAHPKQARYQLRNTPIFNKTPLYYSILGRFRKAFLIMVKIVGWLQKRANFRKTETRRPLCRRDLCCKALLLYRLGGAVARIICGAWSAFLRPWRAHPSWPHAPLRSRRAAFLRSTKRFPPSRPP